MMRLSSVSQAVRQHHSRAGVARRSLTILCQHKLNDRFSTFRLYTCPQRDLPPASRTGAIISLSLIKNNKSIPYFFQQSKRGLSSDVSIDDGKNKQLGLSESRALCQITLTAEEQRFLDLIDQVVANRCPTATVRIAGGWVRNKLLGLPSGDIDLVVDTMTGLELAKHVQDYQKSKGSRPSGMGVVKANPAKSKHLEMAAMQVQGLQIDFAHLRTEHYAQDSRVPSETEIGTPLEDALRRDFTVNSLYYNIKTRSVEDFTEMGLLDLEKGFLRTPGPAETIFHEDPLRVIRAIRFAATFCFKVDQDIIDAGNIDSVRKATRDKVSRERVGVETDKVFALETTSVAWKLAREMSMYDIMLAAHRRNYSRSVEYNEFAAEQELRWVERLDLAQRNGPPTENLPISEIVSAKSSVTSITDMFSRCGTWKANSTQVLGTDEQYLLYADELRWKITSGKIEASTIADEALKLSLKRSKSMTSVATNLSAAVWSFPLVQREANDLGFCRLPLDMSREQLRDVITRLRTPKDERDILTIGLWAKEFYNVAAGALCLLWAQTDWVNDTYGRKQSMDFLRELLAAYNAFPYMSLIRSRPLILGKEAIKQIAIPSAWKSYSLHMGDGLFFTEALRFRYPETAVITVQEKLWPEIVVPVLSSGKIYGSRHDAIMAFDFKVRNFLEPTIEEYPVIVGKKGCSTKRV